MRCAAATNQPAVVILALLAVICRSGCIYRLQTVLVPLGFLEKPPCVRFEAFGKGSAGAGTPGLLPQYGADRPDTRRSRVLML